MENLPTHVAMIMDGNGRWAKKRLLPRSAGHKAGVEALRPLITTCDELGIAALTVYAFSSENWQRPREEVGALMTLLLEFCRVEVAKLHKKNVRIRIIGDWRQAPAAVVSALENAVTTTQNNTGLQLSIAFGYGSRMELARAAALLAQEAVETALRQHAPHALPQNGTGQSVLPQAASPVDNETGTAKEAVEKSLRPQDITPEHIEARLYTAALPPVDLLIRTGGELRLSNFLLYQAAYAELWFTPILWPDFGPAAFRQALEDYAGRQRRFGKVSP